MLVSARMALGELNGKIFGASSAEIATCAASALAASEATMTETSVFLNSEAS